MENFVKTFLHLVKTYKTFPASWKILKKFSCTLKKKPAVYKKLKRFKQLVEKTLVQFRSKCQKIGISRETELLIRRPRRGIGVTMISFLKPHHKNVLSGKKI